MKNSTDYKKFLEFKKKQSALLRPVSEKSRKERIATNLENWLGRVPEAFRQYSSKNLPKETSSQLKKCIRGRGMYPKYVIFHSDSAINSLKLAYSLLYLAIGKGFLAPTEIKFISLIEGFQNIHGMFQSREWKDNVFNKNTKAIVIENVTTSATRTKHKNEEQFWQELTDFTRDSDVLIIICSEIPTASSQSMGDESEKRATNRIPLACDNSILMKVLKKSEIILHRGDIT